MITDCTEYSQTNETFPAPDLGNKIKLLATEQKIIFDAVIYALYNDDRNKLIFIDGPGGSGKSFVLNTIIQYLKKNNKESISVAWTGIAANLLTEGKTAHATLKLPFDITENTTCNVKANDEV